MNLSHKETTTMQHQIARTLKTAACAALLAVAMPAVATDGVIELNQAKILAAGGYPYTIANPGSYILTSNLRVVVDVNGLVITANNVSLNLNGFSILGPNIGCDNSFHAIGAPSSGKQIVIRNGMIDGFCFGIDLRSTTQVTVELMNIDTTGNQAIATGENALLRGNIFNGGNSGVICPSIVVDTSFLHSFANQTSTVTCAKENLIGNF
jgi:hypothetical protein